jgi:hypothetical protein
VAPKEARIFAYSWTFLIPSATFSTPPRLYPFVDSNATMLVQHNWDYDRVAGEPAGMTIATPSRIIAVPDVDLSGDGEEKTSSYATLATELNITWAVSAWAKPTAVVDNLVTFWATNQNGTALAIFARSTNVVPP